jgi:excisionase family DNA binding protein
MESLTLTLPPPLVDGIAERAAELVLERLGENRHGAGYLDVRAAAEFLSCPVSRIYALASAKRIPHHRDGSRLLFDRHELRAYIEGGGARRP